MSHETVEDIKLNQDRLFRNFMPFIR